MEPLTIKTPFGIIFTEVSTDEEYPGISIFLRNNEGTEEVLLTTVEYSQFKDEVRTLFFEDSSDDTLEPLVLKHKLDERFGKEGE